MKKFTFLLAALIAVSGFTACATNSAQISPIGIDAAKLAALESAGINISDVVIEEVELEEKNGQKYYSVDFEVKGQDYEFVIDALTGQIISSNIPSSVQLSKADAPQAKQEDAVKENPASQPAAEPKAVEPKASQSASGSESKASSVISEAKAKEIALSHAGLKESEVSFVRVKLDWDDGRQEYEVDFYKDNVEYDYEIDAVSGKIFSADKEIDDDVKPAGKEESKPAASPAAGAEEPSASVSEAEAKKIALAQVPGAKESDICRFKLDYDDGRVEYEGKIIYNEMEYEFEIDGHSGAIRDWDVESVYDD